MTTRRFIVPDEADILDTLGVEPEPVENETAVWKLRFTTRRHELVFTYDVLGRAVTVELAHEGAALIDVTRDGAVLMRVEWADGEGWIHVDFDTDGLTGTLTVRVHPTVRIKDTLMFT